MTYFRIKFIENPINAPSRLKERSKVAPGWHEIDAMMIRVPYGCKIISVP